MPLQTNYCRGLWLSHIPANFMVVDHISGSMGRHRTLDWSKNNSMKGSMKHFPSSPVINKMGIPAWRFSRDLQMTQRALHSHRIFTHFEQNLQEQLKARGREVQPKGWRGRGGLISTDLCFFANVLNKYTAIMDGNCLYKFV